jgi:hypothetical protein
VVPPLSFHHGTRATRWRRRHPQAILIMLMSYWCMNKINRRRSWRLLGKAVKLWIIARLLQLCRKGMWKHHYLTALNSTHMMILKMKFLKALPQWTSSRSLQMESQMLKVDKVTPSVLSRTTQCSQTRWTLKTQTISTKLFRSMKRCLLPLQVKKLPPRIKPLIFQISPQNRS